MSAFEKIIGYGSVKAELMQICDMVHSPEVYRSLGARLPRGILISGRPGLGKTLMAKCFIEESGLRTYTVRRTVSGGELIGTINSAFREASANAPAIVFLDDLDKFANEDDDHCDAEEYVAVQAAIDETKDSGIFVIATVNDEDKLPEALIRAGRFDRKIEVDVPNEIDSENIIRYYMSDKKMSADVNIEDVSRMISYSSCAELETVLNEAAIRAAYRRSETVEMQDLVGAVLRMVYDSPESCEDLPEAERKMIALHEAGHVAISELVAPGSVGLATVRSSKSRLGGFVHVCRDLPDTMSNALVSLGGKAATELYYPNGCAEGSARDIGKAYNVLSASITRQGICGMSMVEVNQGHFSNSSESFNARNEAVVQAEIEKCMFRVRNLLISNRDFLELLAYELAEKETLLYSDIKRIRESVQQAGAAA